jgi:hypothetical protein
MYLHGIVMSLSDQSERGFIITICAGIEYGNQFVFDPSVT